LLRANFVNWMPYVPRIYFVTYSYQDLQNELWKINKGRDFYLTIYLSLHHEIVQIIRNTSHIMTKSENLDQIPY
jgi:hypothetical protein